MGEVINLLRYFSDDRIAEIRADLERQRKEIERKLAVIAIEEARRDDKDIR